MSAYIVEDSTINSVVTFLATHPEHNTTGLDLSTNATQAALGVGMFALNCNAVEQRHGKGQAKEFRELNYQFVSTPATLAEASENLRCWIYQCSEGDVPDTSKLYQAMAAINERLKPLAEIAIRLAEVEQSKRINAVKAQAKDISRTDTAKMIRTTLKQAFPLTKFSVRSESYSGGGSIDARWTDGPTEDQVKRILDRFDGQGFDGMTDCSYHCGERILNGVLVDFCSGYVRGSRKPSARFLKLVADRVAYECGTATPEVGEHSGPDGYGYMAGDHNQRVPFQWWNHWLKDAQGDQREYLTIADLESSTRLLASDSHEGEYLTRLVDKIAAHVSLEEQNPVELPEYIDVNATVSTGRTSFETPQRMFDGHIEAEREAQAIAVFESIPALTRKVQ